LSDLSSKQAQGTTMIFLTAPSGLLAAITYFQSGYADLKIAAILGIRFFFGAFLSKVATKVPNTVLKKVFGLARLLVAAY